MLNKIQQAEIQLDDADWAKVQAKYEKVTNGMGYEWQTEHRIWSECVREVKVWKDRGRRLVEQAEESLRRQGMAGWQ